MCEMIASCRANIARRRYKIHNIIDINVDIGTGIGKVDHVDFE